MNPSVSHGYCKKEEEFEFNKDAGLYVCSAEHIDQLIFQNSDTFKERAKERYKRYRIEAKNSEWKHRHGYEVASSSGLEGMRIQGAMAILTANVK